MEELKLLIGMVADLPTLAVWVLAGYLLYKVAIIGSIYGVIRLAIAKLHDWAIQKQKRGEEITLTLDGMQFDSTASRTQLLTQLQRLCFIGRPAEHGSGKIYSEYGVKYLREAIDKMCEIEEERLKALRGKS
jgi:hypothetical protein